MHIHELAPGSTGDWYFSPYMKGSPPFVWTNVLSNEKFKGTFVPIFSSLDLKEDFDPYNPQTPDEREMRRWSTFDAVFYLQASKNGYPGSTGGIEDRRYEHIVFDDQVMAKINSALKFIEVQNGKKALPAIFTLLN